eukprot:UN24805
MLSDNMRCNNLQRNSHNRNNNVLRKYCKLEVLDQKFCHLKQETFISKPFSVSQTCDLIVVSYNLDFL